MSIEHLPDELNFGKNSRKLLGANVMPLLNKALQQTMLQLPSNPTYHVAQYLRDNNPARGAQMVEVTVPSIFLSISDEQGIANGSVKLDEVETRMQLRQQEAKHRRRPRQREKRQRQNKTSKKSPSPSSPLSASSGSLQQTTTDVGSCCSQQQQQQQQQQLVHSSSSSPPSANHENRNNSAPVLAPPPHHIHHNHNHPHHVQPRRKSQLHVRFSAEVPAAASAAAAVAGIVPSSADDASNRDVDVAVTRDSQNGRIEAKSEDLTIRIEVGKTERQEVRADDAQEEEEDGDDDEEEEGDEEENEQHQEQDDETKLLQDRIAEENELLFGDGESLREAAAATRELCVKFVGREKDGEASQIRQNGRLPIWTVELPVIDGLESVISRLNEQVFEYEKSQEPLQQHDMNNRHHCFFAPDRNRVPGGGETTKRETGGQENGNFHQHQQQKSTSRDNNTNSVNFESKQKDAFTANKKPPATSWKKNRRQIKIHFVRCGSADVQCYIGGICMRGVLTQEVCDVIRCQKKFDNSLDRQMPDGQEYENICIKALQLGAKMRPNAFQERFRHIVSVEQAVNDAFSSYHQQEMHLHEVYHHNHQHNQSSKKSPQLHEQTHDINSKVHYKSLPCEVHRLCEYHDSAVSEQYVDALHNIAERCASERARGICSVIAVCSTYKASFIRNTCEFFSAYFLQRSRALHLDRVGFAIGNDENIRKLLAQTPLKLHEQALERRRARDDARRRLAQEQARYLQVNDLKEDPEVEKLVKEVAESRRRRREREDRIAVEMTNKCIHRAALRVQMCYKMHLACKSLLEGRTAAILSLENDAGQDADLAKYKIPDPPLLHAITEHLRSSLGADTVAPLDLPRPAKPAIVQKRTILLVRHRKIPNHQKLQDLDVSSEEEDWFEVEKERSSESNRDAARAAVSAPCRPWDDVATLCRWCHEDGLLNECCDLAEEFSGRCSLENRLLRDFERLSYLIFYDVYCFMLWRDRTSANRYVHQPRSEQQLQQQDDSEHRQESFSFAAFVRDSKRVHSSSSGGGSGTLFTPTLLSPRVNGGIYGNKSNSRKSPKQFFAGNPVEVETVSDNNNNNNDDDDEQDDDEQQQQQGSLSLASAKTGDKKNRNSFSDESTSVSLVFSEFLETWCSKAVAILNSSSWSVSTALGLFYQKPFLSLNPNGSIRQQQQMVTSSNLLRSHNPVVLPMSLAEIVSSGSSPKDLSKKTATAIAANTSMSMATRRHGGSGVNQGISQGASASASASSSSATAAMVKKEKTSPKKSTAVGHATSSSSTCAGGFNRNNNNNNNNNNHKHPKSFSTPPSSSQHRQHQALSTTQNVSKEKGQVVIFGSAATPDPHQRSSSSSVFSATRRKHLESPWMRKTIHREEKNGDEAESALGSNSNNKNEQQRHRRPPPPISQVQAPISLAPVNDHLFLDDVKSKNKYKNKMNINNRNNNNNNNKSNVENGNDDDDDDDNTNQNDSGMMRLINNIKASGGSGGGAMSDDEHYNNHNIFQNRAPRSEGERSSEFGLLEAVGANDNDNNVNVVAGGVGDAAAAAAAALSNNNNNVVADGCGGSRAIRLDPKLTAVEQPFPDLPGTFYFVSEAMPLKAVFDTCKNIFAESNWLLQQQQISSNGNTPHQVKGICWVSTIADPILYVEEDEVISLSARPAHAKFDLNGLLPASAFLGYSQTIPPNIKSTSSKRKNSTSGSSFPKKTQPSIGRSTVAGGESESVLSGSTLAPPPSNLSKLNYRDHSSEINNNSSSGISSAAHHDKVAAGTRASEAFGASMSMMSRSSAQQQRAFCAEFGASCNPGSQIFVSTTTTAPTNLRGRKNLVTAAPDPFSSHFWSQQEDVFLEKVKKQLTKWRGALYLFGSQSYNEVLMLTASSATESQTRQQQQQTSAFLGKPSRGRCVFWFGPEAGALFSTFFNTTTATSMRKLRLQQCNLLEHPATIPKISAIKKTFRVAPENLQYERAIGTAAASLTSSSPRRQQQQQQDGQQQQQQPEIGEGITSMSFAEQLRRNQQRLLQQEEEQQQGREVDSRPMSATHSSIGSWSDVVKLNRRRSNLNAKNSAKSKGRRSKNINDDNTKTTKSLNYDEDNHGGDDDDDWSDEEYEEDDDEDEDDDAQGEEDKAAQEKIDESDAARAHPEKQQQSQAKQLMLPSVRTAAAVENLVRNKLVAYKCGHHNDPSNGVDPRPFSYVRFPITDGFGKAFLDRLDEFRRTIQEQRHNVAFVFTISSPTSVFTSLIAIITRMLSSSSSLPSQAQAQQQQQYQQQQQQQYQQHLFSNRSHKNYENLRRLALRDAEFLATEVHVLFRKLAQVAFESFVDVLILLRRANLLHVVVAVVDTHRQFAENASRAPPPQLTCGVTKLPGTTSSTASEFSDLSKVQQKKLVAWYSAQSAQKLERFCVLVMMHAFLSSASSSSSRKASFFDFCMGLTSPLGHEREEESAGETVTATTFREIMENYLLDRIDPWEVPPNAPSIVNQRRKRKANKQQGLDPQQGTQAESISKRSAFDSLENTQKTNASSSSSSSSASYSTSLNSKTSSPLSGSSSLLEKTMRSASVLPLASPLHPLSSATHKNKRWSKELWLERAA